jgi:hypothetical protein
MGPEIWFGIGAVVLILGLAYAAIRAGRLTRRERQRTDAATVAVQRSEEAREKSRSGA